MQRKVIISCAVTGSADTPARNPAVPVTPEQIAGSALDAAKAGAAIVHIHVRDPQTAKPSEKHEDPGGLRPLKLTVVGVSEQPRCEATPAAWK